MSSRLSGRPRSPVVGALRSLDGLAEFDADVLHLGGGGEDLGNPKRLGQVTGDPQVQRLDGRGAGLAVVVKDEIGNLADALAGRVAHARVDRHRTPLQHGPQLLAILDDD